MNFAKKIIQFFFVVIPVVVFGWLLFRNVGFFSPLEANFDFRGASAFVSDMKPVERVGGIMEEGGGRFQTIIGDPVYVEIATPPIPFRSVRVDVVYRVRGQPFFALGIRRGKTGSDMELHPLFLEETKGVPTYEGDWMRSGADFDLRDAFQNSRHRLVLIFSAPDVQKNGGSVDIREIRVRYERDPIVFSDITQSIKEGLWRFFHGLL